MKDPIRHFSAEFVGIFALTFVGGATVMLSKTNGSTIGLAEIALSHGIILAIMVTATMRVSGHLNPAVTLGFLATRRIEPVMAGLYIVAQLLGAVVAAYALKAVFPAALFAAARGGGQTVSMDITTGAAFGAEFIATFFLTFVIWGTAVDPEAPKVGGFAIGLTVAADILAIGPLTGASMNPARSFGPALVTRIFEAQFIYWVAPILGAVAGALFYEHVILHRPVEPEDHGAVRPATKA